MALAKGIAASAALCILILVLAAGSNLLLDRYGLAGEPTGDACLGADGTPRNWPWPNAPTLWPKCEDDAPTRMPPAKKN